MRDVFISHVTEDADMAVALANGLEAAGYATWYYERDAMPGLSYIRQISEGVVSSSAVLVLVSAASLGSAQVDAEVVRGFEDGKPFVPILRGVSHEELRSRKPQWTVVFGSVATMQVPFGRPSEVAAAVCSRIIGGLKALAVPLSGAASSQQAVAAPSSRAEAVPVPAQGRPPLPTEYDAFISHRKQDFPLAERVYSHLVSSGLVVFLSEKTLPQMGNADYRKGIDTAIDASRHMIVVAANGASAAESWVEHEWGMFLNEKLGERKVGNIVTMVGENCEIRDLPISLRSQEVIPISEEGLQRLLSYLWK